MHIDHVSPAAAVVIFFKQYNPLTTVAILDDALCNSFSSIFQVALRVTHRTSMWSVATRGLVCHCFSIFINSPSCRPIMSFNTHDHSIHQGTAWGLVMETIEIKTICVSNTPSTGTDLIWWSQSTWSASAQQSLIWWAYAPASQGVELAGSRQWFLHHLSHTMCSSCQSFPSSYPSAPLPPPACGAFLNSGILYSVIRFTALCHLSGNINPKWQGELDDGHPQCRSPFLSILGCRTCRVTRRKLGSVVITSQQWWEQSQACVWDRWLVTSLCGTPICVRHRFLEHCSSWVVGHNLMSWSNIIQMDCNHKEPSVPDGDLRQLLPIDVHIRIYTPASFFRVRRTIFTACLAPSPLPEKSFRNVQKVFSLILKHMVGNSSLEDITMLLIRNNPSIGDASKWPNGMSSSCGACHSMAKPQLALKESFSSTTPERNYVILMSSHLYYIH